MMCNKGGFFNAHTSGVRQGGAYEARQWVWGVKNASRKDPRIKEALEHIEKNFDGWMRRYPFVRGSSPLSVVPEYEGYIFDQAEKADYGPYWQQIGLNTEEHLDEFADIPALFLSGWYDIYARSTIDFYTALSQRKKGPLLLIMGPWQHVGAEGHVAGEVDFGVNALVSGNLAPNMFSLSRRWFDRWVDPATSPAPRKMTPEEKLQMAIRAAEEQQGGEETEGKASGSLTSPAHTPHTPTSLMVTTHPRGPYTSLSHMSASSPSAHSVPLTSGPSIYIPPSTIPRERPTHTEPLPPPVRYFRMGGGDGHKTSQHNMFHGGVWMQAAGWPPAGTRAVRYVLGRRSLAEEGAGGGEDKTVRATPRGSVRGEGAVERGKFGGKKEAWQRSEGEGEEPHPPPFTAAFPPPGLLHVLDHSTTFPFDPRNPCPTIGGNLFGFQNILMAGAYNQHERSDHFLCSPPYLPLSSRRDVIVFRTAPLQAKLDITGTPTVQLYVSTTAVDTDFTVKLIDEYPPSLDYPQGFAMQVTHGIQRLRYRESREKHVFAEPGKVYKLEVTMYPTSNLFSKGSA
jgi:predicted acyl esterase